MDYTSEPKLIDRVFNALFPLNSHPLRDHLVRELRLAGFMTQTSVYTRVGAVLDKMMRVFTNAKLSEEETEQVAEAFRRLALHRPLTANDHSLHLAVAPGGTLLQDLRDPTWFSEDGGKTWFNVHAPRNKRTEGMYAKYIIERTDGKQVNWAFVLEDKDPRALPALKAYADAAEAAGYGALAADLGDKIMELERLHGVASDTPAE